MFVRLNSVFQAALYQAVNLLLACKRRITGLERFQWQLKRSLVILSSTLGSVHGHLLQIRESITSLHDTAKVSRWVGGFIARSSCLSTENYCGSSTGAVQGIACEAPHICTLFGCRSGHVQAGPDAIQCLAHDCTPNTPFPIHPRPSIQGSQG